MRFNFTDDKMVYYVGTVGFNSWEDAQKYARDRGMLDVLQDPRVDLIDRELGVFVARNIPKHEADAMMRGSPEYTQAPAGQYTEESIRGLSYTPDVRGGVITSTIVEQEGKNIPISEANVQVGNIEVSLNSGLNRQDISNIKKAVASGQIKQPQQVGDIAKALIYAKQPTQTERQRLSRMTFETGETFGVFAERAGREAKESLFAKQAILAQTGRTPEQLGEAIVLSLFERQALLQETGKTREQFSLGLQQEIKTKQDTLFPERTFGEAFKPLGKLFKPPIESSFLKESALVKSAQKASEFSVIGLYGKAESKAGKFISGQPIIKLFESGFERGIKQSERILGDKPATLGGQSKAVLEFGLGTLEGIKKVPIKETALAYVGGRALGKGEQIFKSAKGSPLLLKIAQIGLGGTFVLGTLAKAKEEEISPARQLGREGLLLTAFGKGYTTQISKGELKAPRPYYHPIYKKTESGQRVIVDFDYTKLVQPKYYDVTKLKVYRQVSKTDAFNYNIVRTGKDILETERQTKIYVKPRKAKELITLSILSEKIGYTGKIEIEGKQFPTFLKIDYGKGIGILENPFKAKRKVSSLIVELFKGEPIREQRIGSARQKLEPYEFKPKKSTNILIRTFKPKIKGKVGIEIKEIFSKQREYNIFEFRETKKAKELARRKELLSTGKVEGTPISLPKLTKILGAEKSTKPKKIIDFRGLYQEQIQKTEIKLRKQKAILDIQEIKPKSRLYTAPTLKYPTEEMQKIYPLIYEENFPTRTAAKPIVELMGVQGREQISIGISQFFISEPKIKPTIVLRKLQRSKSILGFETKSDIIQRITPIIDIGITQKPRQEIKPILEIRQITKQKRIFDFKEYPPERKFIWISPIPQLEDKYNLSKPSKFKRKYTYTPSVTAIVRGKIKVGKPPKRIYGQEERPVYVPKSMVAKARRMLR